MLQLQFSISMADFLLDLGYIEKAERVTSHQPELGK